MIRHIKLRWRGIAAEAYQPATHMRIERSLSELELRPPGMPPNAVLLIRSIKGLPSLQEVGSLSVEWLDAVRGNVELLFQRAIRPQNGYIPENAESILFLDFAEALAGLTQSVIENHFQEHWCWSQLIPDGGYTAQDALVLAWSRYINYLPSAFKELTLTQIATAVRLLGPWDVEVVVRELREAFNLPPIPHKSVVEHELEDHITADLSYDRADPIASTEPPWRDWLLALPEELSQDRHYLIGLAVTLGHAPAYARSDAFAAQTAEWFASPTPPTNTYHVNIVSRSEDNVREISSDETINSKSQSGDSIDPSTDFLKIRNPEANHATAPTEIVDDETLEIALHGLWSEYGGIFYLVNLMDWLFLPHAWDQSVVQHLTSWAFVELLARSLLPDDLMESGDPIWQILATLDARTLDTLIGMDFPAQTSFHLPVRLFQRYAPSTTVHWRAAVINGSLRLLDETHQYLIIEEPLRDRDPTALIESLISEYETDETQITWKFGEDIPDQPLPHSVKQVVMPALEIWLQKLLGYARYWLMQFVDAVPEDLIKIGGRVLVSHTHVDVFFPINAVDIRVRQAGLDRNPGWLPDFGYIILFHFIE